MKNKIENLYNYCHSLIDIRSNSKKANLISNAENYLTALLVKKYNPDALSEKDIQTIDKIKNSLDETDKDLLAEIFLAKYMGITMDEPDFTIDVIKDLYANGLYFTKKEIDDIINWQLTRPVENIDVDVIFYLLDCIKNNLYFKTDEEADKAMEEYEKKNMKMSYREAIDYLASLDNDSLPLSSGSTSTSPSTISLS